VQPSGGVGPEILEARHLAYLRRNRNKIAAVEVECSDGTELGDRGRERDDLPPLLLRHLGARGELFAAIVGCVVNQIEKSSPRFACRVLSVGVESKSTRGLRLLADAAMARFPDLSQSGQAVLEACWHVDRLCRHFGLPGFRRVVITSHRAGVGPATVHPLGDDHPTYPIGEVGHPLQTFPDTTGRDQGVHSQPEVLNRKKVP
jgi:hypothetical protein